MATVNPLSRDEPVTAAPPEAPAPPAMPGQRRVATPRAVPVKRPQPSTAMVMPRPLPVRHGLDAGWDRKLLRGAVQPDATIDLHGHSLSSAWHLLDHALDRAIARGDRVLLVVTGKPPRPESERPHARGAIRAAVGDWLQASRHRDAIAAVRGAGPRHGGAGALYIVLRRDRSARNY